MYNCLNEKLLNLQKDWLLQINADELAKDYPISRPFCFAVTKEFTKTDRRIMIVGQEAANYGLYSSAWPVEEIQVFNVEYVSKQLGYKENDHAYNRSPFWKLFRKLKDSGFEPVWNNIDKFHRVYMEQDKDGKDKEKTVPLSSEIERLVDAPYGEEKKSLLVREIELTNPCAVLFVIGPYYHEALSLSLGISDDTICDYKPNKAQPCRVLSDVASLGRPVLWSYHPAYLNRVHELDTVVAKVKSLLSAEGR